VKLVAAIMPTRGRAEYARQALESFLGQTYEKKELLILDDADDPSFPEGIPSGAATRSVYRLVMKDRLSIPQKRNFLLAISSADIFMHFDSDDWSAPCRMAEQVRWMEESGRAVCGFNSVLFYEESSGDVYRYDGSPGYAIGTTLAYRKSWWVANPFPEDKPIGEDNSFVRSARSAKQLCTVPGAGLIVARAHSDNTSRKNLLGTSYTRIDRGALPPAFLQTSANTAAAARA
jgi:glycosyltransferase involved in cell wall biosynthesis